jgi:hypothetical protein
MTGKFISKHKRHMQLLLTTCKQLPDHTLPVEASVNIVIALPFKHACYVPQATTQHKNML